MTGSVFTTTITPSPTAVAQNIVVEDLGDDEGYFASIATMPGVWGSGDTREEAITDLIECIPEWASLREWSCGDR